MSLSADEVTTKEAAEYLGTSIDYVLKLIRQERLVADKKGTRDYWVTAQSLKEFKKERRPRGRPPETLSAEPAQNKRLGGAGEAAEREREYQREYKRRMRAAQKKPVSSTAAKAAAKKRSRP